MSLTINYLKEKEYPLDHVLTSDDKIALIEENKDGDYSYVSLMKEMFHYNGVTVHAVLEGWGGVRVFYP